MTQILNQQPQELFFYKSQLEMAELLLNQNTLGLQIMLSNKMNQSEPFPAQALNFLEESIRCNHNLSYNLIMSYISENVIAEPPLINNEICQINEQNLYEQQQVEEERKEVRQDEQQQQVQEEQKEEVREIEETETFSDDDLLIEIFEDYGLSKNQINKLPTYKWTELFNDASNLLVKSKAIHKTKKNLSSTEEACCICLCKYRSNSKLRKLPCNHYFHMKCIDRWLKKNAKCPCCRKSLGAL